MTSDTLFNKIIAVNFTKSAATAALSAFSEAANKTLFKDKDTDTYEGLTHDNAQNIIEETRKKIEKMEPMVITLATALPEDKIADLGAKIRKLFGDNFLFELGVNPALLGGAQIVYRGKMLDLSFKKKLETSRSQILEICNKYLT